MQIFIRRALGLVLFLPPFAVSAASAATPPVQAPPAGSPAAVEPAASGATERASRTVDKRVIEDGKVRIEEVRVQGQTHSVMVTSKLPGVKTYEVIQPPLGKDPSQDKGAAGKRTWSLFDF